MGALIEHKKRKHGIVMGGRPSSKAGELSHEHIEHTHDHPHSHDFGERITFIQEGTKELKRELLAKQQELELELIKIQSLLKSLEETVKLTD